MLKSYPSGTSIRLNCTFKDFNNQNADPQLVKIIIYNHRYEIIEQLTPTKKSVGEYYLDYKTPIKSQTIYYEWYGEIDGMPSIMRDGFLTKFM